MGLIKVKNVHKIFKTPQKSKLFGLIKQDYKVVEALKNISFEVPEGQIIGYIGRNGSGKSTTIKLLTGIMQPSKGQIIIDGLDPYKHRKQLNFNIGTVFGQRTQLWWDLPLIDSLILLKDIYNINSHDFQKKLKKYNEVLQLDQILHKPVRFLSLGQRMKGDLAAALLHSPKILYLDEPTIGLDIETKELIREFILEINKENNVTVILTTHDVSDINQLCERIIFIDEGKIYFDDSMNKLKEKFGSNQIISLKADSQIQIPTQISNRVNIQLESEYEVICHFDESLITSSEILFSFIQAKNVITDFRISAYDPESLIKNLYRSSLEEVKNVTYR